MFSMEGDSALVLLVPEADPAVARWRAEHDPSAEEGMPAHITVLYPFSANQTPADEVRRSTAEFAAIHPQLELTFSTVGHFPNVLWLDPASPECVQLLTDARRRWPECLPYGRSDLPVIPHLTVADGAAAGVLRTAELDVAARLPIRSRVGALSLMIFDGTRWIERERFGFGRRVVPEALTSA